MQLGWAVVAAVSGVACDDAESARNAPPMPMGQWIWSRTDSAVYVTAARAKPDLVATVWIGSVHVSAEHVTGSLGLSPRVAGSGQVAVVIRFEDTFTRAFAPGAKDLTAAIDSTLLRLLATASATGVSIAEVQLDYDCPQRLLPRWAALVGDLSRGGLAGRTVWVTSLVSHVRHPSYGDLFRPHVTGHILQVFDTGDQMTSSYAKQVAHLANRQRMPFRLGVGAFERRLANGRETDHTGWFGAVATVAQSPWYRGLWVFPGGQSWIPPVE